MNVLAVAVSRAFVAALLLDLLRGHARDDAALTPVDGCQGEAVGEIAEERSSDESEGDVERNEVGRRIVEL